MGEWESFSWEGRQLKSYYDDEIDTNVIFTYNADGIRVGKNFGSYGSYEYILEGSQILAEIRIDVVRLIDVIQERDP